MFQATEKEWQNALQPLLLLRQQVLNKDIACEADQFCLWVEKSGIAQIRSSSKEEDLDHSIFLPFPFPFIPPLQLTFLHPHKE